MLGFLRKSLHPRLFPSAGNL